MFGSSSSLMAWMWTSFGYRASQPPTVELCMVFFHKIITIFVSRWKAFYMGFFFNLWQHACYLLYSHLGMCVCVCENMKHPLISPLELYLVLHPFCSQMDRIVDGDIMCLSSITFVLFLVGTLTCYSATATLA